MTSAPDRREVEVVRRLVQQQQLRGRFGQHQRGERGAEAFAAGERARPLVGAGALEQEAGEPGPDALGRAGAKRATFSTTRQRRRRAPPAAGAGPNGTAPTCACRGSSPATVAAAWSCPTPLGPTSAIRSGPRTSRSTARRYADEIRRVSTARPGARRCAAGRRGSRRRRGPRLGLVEPVPRRPRAVPSCMLAVLARRYLRGLLLARPATIFGSRRCALLFAVAPPRASLPLGLGQFALLAPYVGLGDPQHPLGRLLLDRDRSS